MNNEPFTDGTENDPKPIAVLCTFRDKDRENVRISVGLYDNIKEVSDSSMVYIKDVNGKMQFAGKRREIKEFQFIYFKDPSAIPDQYQLYHAEYMAEKTKRDKFWNEYSPKMTQDQKDSVWSIIMARWGNTYKEAKEGQYGGAWKAYFKGMFKIIALELAGHKDKISSKNGIIANWSKDPETGLSRWEIPEMYDNLPMYREFIK